MSCVLLSYHVDVLCPYVLPCLCPVSSCSTLLTFCFLLSYLVDVLCPAVLPCSRPVSCCPNLLTPCSLLSYFVDVLSPALPPCWWPAFFGPTWNAKRPVVLPCWCPASCCPCRRPSSWSRSPWSDRRWLTDTQRADPLAEKNFIRYIDGYNGKWIYRDR